MDVCRYRIDPGDVIIRVNEAWSSFAIENNAPWLVGESVINKRLWDYIDGAETREIYRGLFLRVRGSGTPVKIPYRCDSPWVRRFMEMTITPLAGMELQFDCVLLRIEERGPVELFDAGRIPSGDVLEVCSWCRRIKLPGGGWVEAEEAVAALDLFGSARLPGLSHGICDRCGGIFTR